MYKSSDWEIKGQDLGKEKRVQIEIKTKYVI